MDADVIIVGGGTAGCVLASRLSEDAFRKVLLIEAGIDTRPDATPADIADAFPRAYANAAYFWPGLQARGRSGSAARPYMQARLLGGGSQVMGMWAVRGLVADYDGWRDGGARGWGFADVLPYLNKLERDLDCISPEHGRDGPIAVCRVPPEEWPGFDKALGRAAARRGLVSHPDLNARDVDGLYSLPLMLDQGVRASAARGYLTNEVRRRPNLAIMTETEVRAVLFAGRRARGVTIRRTNSADADLSARAVILAAGGIHSPTLLLRSGIGPAAELRRLGVPIAADAPEVGRNLQNHAFVHLGAVIRRPFRQHPGMRQYAMAGVRLSSKIDAAPDGDLFVSFIARTSGHRAGNCLGLVGPSLYAPFSRGAVGLDPRNPRGSPLVDFNLVADPRDAARIIHGARFARSLLEDEAVREATCDCFIMPPNPPIKLFNRNSFSSRFLNDALAALVGMGQAPRQAALRRLLAPGKLLADLRNDDEFDDLVLAGVAPMFHPAGACAIGAVVGPEGQVIGVENLRVIDASIMPTIPRGNTNIPTLMVAEKCAAAFRRAG